MSFDSKKELRKLKKIFKDIPKDKREIVEGLVADAAFMIEQLEELREDILENGWSEEYCNGANQYGRKNRVEADMYIKLQKSYQSTIKQLTDCLPSDKQDGINKAGESLAKFIAQGKPIKPNA